MEDVKVTTVPGRAVVSSETLREALEEHCREMYEQGWELRTMTSRGGTIYCVFYRKAH